MNNPSSTPAEPTAQAVQPVTTAGPAVEKAHTRNKRRARVKAISFDELSQAIASAIGSIPASGGKWHDQGEAARGRLMFLSGWFKGQRPEVAKLLRELAGVQ